jgi:hypothetical protein
VRTFVQLEFPAPEFRIAAYSYEFLPGCWSIAPRSDAYTLWYVACDMHLALLRVFSLFDRIPFAIFDGDISVLPPSYY